MDIWTVPTGDAVDLGELAPGPPGLDLAGRVLALVASRVDGRLESLTWHADPPPDTVVRLTLVDRSRDGLAIMRLHSVAPTGRATLLADVRCRRTPGRGGDTPLLTAPVRPGDHNRCQFPVDERMLTDHIPGRAPVLTTPDLVGLFEETAARILRPRLAPAAASVGTWIGIRHTGAAVGGERVDVRAVVAAVHGRRITFDVHAHVGARPIGDGQIAQTLIAI